MTARLTAILLFRSGITPPNRELSELETNHAQSTSLILGTIFEPELRGYLFTSLISKLVFITQS